jgi:hypothetical protein
VEDEQTMAQCSKDEIGGLSGREGGGSCWENKSVSAWKQYIILRRQSKPQNAKSACLSQVGRVGDGDLFDGDVLIVALSSSSSTLTCNW